MIESQTDSLVPDEKEVETDFSLATEPIDLEEFAKKLFDSVEGENPDEENKRFKRWQKNRAFYRGNQRGFWDTKKRTWVTVDLDSLTPSEASVLVVNNQFRPQIKTLAKEFSRSQTRVRANGRSDSQRSVLAARFGDSLIKYYQPELLPETKRQMEAKYLFLTGNSFRYTIYDKNAKSSKIKQPKFGEKELPEYTTSVCPECGYKTSGVKGQCPECDSLMETTTVKAKKINNVLVGYETINAGDPRTEIVDPSEVKVWAGAKGGDLNATPYMRRRRFVKSEYINEIFPFYKVKQAPPLSESAQAQFKFNDVSGGGDISGVLQGLQEYSQLWIIPAYYFNKHLEKDVTFKKFISGKYVSVTLKAGTKMIDAFPDGMYLCKVNTDILGYYNENFLEHWQHISYDINIDGFWGDGLEDAVMNQQIINEYTSLSVENVLYNASPKLVVNPSLINPVTVTGRPKDIILMSDNARRDNEPKQGFAQIEGMSLTQDVMNGIVSAKTDMREQTGAVLAFNGQGDPNITTATGMSIARDSALALISTPLSLRAEVDAEWCWQVLRIVKKYWYDNKYKFLLGKYNEAESEAFRDSDIDEELNLYVEPNSWMPLTNYEKVQNLGAYMTAFGIPFGFLNPQIPEVVRNYASTLYNIPFDFDELAPDMRIAQKRLDIAKEVASRKIPEAMREAAAYAVAGKPEIGQIALGGTARIISDAMGVEEDLDDHQVFIDQYKKWLKTDEGQNANTILRQAVKKTIADHQAFLDGEKANAAQQQGLMAGLAGPPQPQSNQPSTWAQNQPPESPFQVKSKVQDFSSNKDVSNL